MSYTNAAQDPIGPSAAAGASWFAVQVRTTHEKRVASLLDQKGYELFVPLYKETRRWSDRIKEMDQPLFPGYVFCRFHQDGRLTILKTPGVYRVVGIGLVPAPIDADEILAIQNAMQSGLVVRPHPYLSTGQRVRIESGSLNGVEGLIVDIKRRDRLVLSVSLLQRSVAVEIDTAWVSPLN